MLKQKKGNINLIIPAILALVLGAAVLFFGLIINDKLRDTSAIYSTTVINESGWLNQSGYTFTPASAGSGFNSPSIIQIINGSSGSVITSTNYTIVGNTIYNASAVKYDKANITYSYLHGDVAYGAANRTSVGLASFADFWSLIVLAVVISVVVGALLLILSSRKVK